MLNKKKSLRNNIPRPKRKTKRDAFRKSNFNSLKYLESQNSNLSSRSRKVTKSPITQPSVRKLRFAKKTPREIIKAIKERIKQKDDDLILHSNSKFEKEIKSKSQTSTKRKKQ